MSRPGERDRHLDDPGPDAEDPDRRPVGPLESLFQEAVRRAAGLGISGLASTEEAVRRAVGERLPDDWSRFLGEQGESLRREISNRLALEFADFLRSDEFEEKLRRLLASLDFEVGVRFSASPKRPPAGAAGGSRAPEE